MFSNIYKGKKVLITGHTGFKGTWLTSWLLELGAEIVGVSKDIPTEPSMFEAIGIKSKIKHVIGDVRNLEMIRDLIVNEKPDFIFHLAAQAIVSLSYSDPGETLSTNIIGTMNVLEAVRKQDRQCHVVLITSDKCYDNVEWVWGYRETDSLGGKDVYSGSKGAAELVIKSYFHSFFKENHSVRLAVARAGNVIGGGDWAADRIIVDCVKSWADGKPVTIRSPNATRPWQHVLEPLSGYLTLGWKLVEDERINGEAFNFGPRSEQNRNVVQLLSDLGKAWGFKEPNEAYQITDNIPFHEAGLLKLNCDKALFLLKWESTLHYEETIRLISDWYGSYYKGGKDIYVLTRSQISEYAESAKLRGREWNKVGSKE